MKAGRQVPRGPFKKIASVGGGSQPKKEAPKLSLSSSTRALLKVSVASFCKTDVETKHRTVENPTTNLNLDPTISHQLYLRVFASSGPRKSSIPTPDINSCSGTVALGSESLPAGSGTR